MLSLRSLPEHVARLASAQTTRALVRYARQSPRLRALWRLLPENLRRGFWSLRFVWPGLTPGFFRRQYAAEVARQPTRPHVLLAYGVESRAAPWSGTMARWRAGSTTPSCTLSRPHERT